MVIDQTYDFWEILIIDGCSQDESAEIIKAFVAVDNRIKLKTDVLSGSPTLPRNIGIQEAIRHCLHS